jgi:thiosulfate/3-mercaptopyruvate sulfurtransferase
MATGPGPLAGAAELGELMAGPAAPVLLDVRWRHDDPDGYPRYLDGHLPGARYVDLDTELCGRPGPDGRRPVPAPEAFTAAMRTHGVSAGRDVVVYDDVAGTAAARAWWLLRHYGVDRVRLLDGGYPAWCRAGGPVESGPPRPARPGDLPARPGRLPTIDAGAALALAARGALLDARPAARYRGEYERRGAPAGHIPGALSLPSEDVVRPDGTFLPPEELLGLLAARGVGPEPVGVYCGSGLLACHLALALATTGIPAALYEGSWSHWTMDPARPVATGEAP